MKLNENQKHKVWHMAAHIDDIVSDVNSRNSTLWINDQILKLLENIDEPLFDDNDDGS